MHKCEPEGVVLTITPGGVIQTPMRAELRGAILSLAAEKEVSLAADNAGVAKGIRRALYAIKRNRIFPYYKRLSAYLENSLGVVAKACRGSRESIPRGGARMQARSTRLNPERLRS